MVLMKLILQKMITGKIFRFFRWKSYHLEVGKGNDGINPLPEEFNQTYWIGMKSCEAIRKYDFNKPLFMMTNFVDPHHPFDPAEKFARMYDGVEIDSPISKDKFCNERPEYLKKEKEDIGLVVVSSINFLMKR